MRISDWSSDVCSSDLRQPPFLAEPVGPSGGAEHGDRPVIVVAVLAGRRDLANIFDGRRGGAATEARAFDTASGRPEAELAEHRARGGIVDEMRCGQPRDAERDRKSPRLNSSH